MTHAEIGRHLNRDAKSISRRIKRLNLNPRPPLKLMPREEDAALISERQIRAKAQEYRESMAALSLDEELANMRAVRDLIMTWANGQEITGKMLNMLMESNERVVGVIKSVAHVLNTTALTQAEVQFLQVRILEVAPKFVEPDRLNEFIREITSPLGTTVGSLTEGAGEAEGEPEH